MKEGRKAEYPEKTPGDELPSIVSGSVLTVPVGWDRASGQQWGESAAGSRTTRRLA